MSLPGQDTNQLKNLIFKLPEKYHHSLIHQVLGLRIQGFLDKLRGFSLIITRTMEIVIIIIIIKKSILLMKGLLTLIVLTKNIGKFIG